ncbi:MAG: tyrosine-type recombinase/integrase [Vampirovibrio sp.]
MNSTSKFRKTSASSSALLPELFKPNYSIAEAALLIGKSEDTLTRWCKSGKLPAIPERFGSRQSFRIPQASLRVYFQERTQEAALGEQLKLVRQQQRSAIRQGDLLEKFRKSCLQGVITGRPFSVYTATYYHDHMRKFFDQFSRLSYVSLKDRLLDIPAERFATRDKLFKAAICFAKFLIQEKQAEEALIDELKPLKPKRHLPPKRISVDDDGLVAMLEAAKADQEDHLIVMLLAQTGLRAGEFCNLKIGDLDLKNRVLTVTCGKGGKSRVVGLTETLTEALKGFLVLREEKSRTRPLAASEWLFLNDRGKQMDKDGLNQRIKRIGRLAGVTVTTHAMRRAFVTINANKGRSLVMLQMACGHADIKTTRDYCRTSEQEMVKAMQEWG